MQRFVPQSMQIQRLGFMGALLIDVVALVLAANTLQQTDGSFLSKTLFGVGTALTGLILFILAINFPSLQWDLSIDSWSFAVILASSIASTVLFWLGYIQRPSLVTNQVTPNFEKYSLASAIVASALSFVALISPWLVMSQ